MSGTMDPFGLELWESMNECIHLLMLKTSQVMIRLILA